MRNYRAFEAGEFYLSDTLEQSNPCPLWRGMKIDLHGL